MVNPFPNKTLFLRIYSTSLLKTPWEKEKVSQKTFRHFYQSLNRRHGTLSLEVSKILSFGKGLTLQNNKFENQFKLKAFADNKFKYAQMEEFLCLIELKTCIFGKEKLLVSPFPTMFSKGLFLRFIESC